MSNTWVRKLVTIQYRCGKAALGLHSNLAAFGVRAEFANGLSELKFRRSWRQTLKMTWWARVCAAPQEWLVSLLFRRRHAEVIAGGLKFSGLRSMQELLVSNGFSEEWLGRRAGPEAEWDGAIGTAVQLLRLIDYSRNQDGYQGSAWASDGFGDSGSYAALATYPGQVRAVLRRD
jgi:hypothetical protein